ncbi:MAG: radical SAM protein [Desulfotomaculaceae bacterium]|nr:radical SAM protein [Desulfotomaculaceae bacterium]
MALAFEQGPIRPPSEAHSLLIRLTRNCPWNRCAFCNAYKGTTFSVRTVEDIKKDIDTIAEMSRLIARVSQGNDTDGLQSKLYESGEFQLYHVANWLASGGKTVFLQDGNSMLLKTAALLEILAYMKEKLPTVERITSYARSDTLLRKSVDELAQLKQAGISRVHVGLESGCDEVLKFMDKGVTAQQHIDAGKRVKESGISLSEYILLGLGGRKWAKEHPFDTARVLSAINPDYIRLRTLAIVENTPLYTKMQQGAWEEQPDANIVEEEKILIENLNGIESRLLSDHSMNLLGEINGNLPHDKPAMLQVIDRFLALPETEKNNFILGKRWGLYNKLNDLQDPERHARVENTLQKLQSQGTLEATIANLKYQMVRV